VDVLTPEGKPVVTRRGKIKKRMEIDPEAAEWIVRGAKMIVRDNRSPGAVAVVFNDNNVGGARTWSSNRIRKLYARSRLVGVEVFRMTKQIRDRDTGHVDVVENDRATWMTRRGRTAAPNDQRARATQPGDQTTDTGRQALLERGFTPQACLRRPLRDQ
jgi:hypothetical protein